MKPLDRYFKVETTRDVDHFRVILWEYEQVHHDLPHAQIDRQVWNVYPPGFWERFFGITWADKLKAAKAKAQAECDRLNEANRRTQMHMTATEQIDIIDRFCEGSEKKGGHNPPPRTPRPSKPPPGQPPA